MNQSKKSIGFESLLIGSMVRYQNNIPLVCDILDTSDFESKPMREAFEICKASFMDGEPITIDGLYRRLSEQSKAQILEISDSADNAHNKPEFYAKDIQKRSMANRVKIACNTALAKVEADDNFADIQGMLMDAFITNKEGTCSKSQDILKDIEFSRDSLNQITIPMRFEKMTELIDIFHEGYLTVLAGRPGQGKSTFMRNILSEVSDRGHPCIIFSMEMTPEIIERLIIFQEAKVPSSSKRLKYITDDELNKLKFIKRLQGSEDIKRYYFDKMKVNPMTVKMAIKQVRAETGRTPIVFLDHLHLMDHVGKDSENIQLGNTTKALKRIAEEQAVPIILLAQLNRKPQEASDRLPRLHHLRGSGSIEQDADNVLFIWSEEDDPKEVDLMTIDKPVGRGIYIAKSRYGQADIAFKLLFFKSIGRFENVVYGADTTASGQTP